MEKKKKAQFCTLLLVLRDGKVRDALFGHRTSLKSSLQLSFCCGESVEVQLVEAHALSEQVLGQQRGCLDIACGQMLQREEKKFFLTWKSGVPATVVQLTTHLLHRPCTIHTNAALRGKKKKRKKKDRFSKKRRSLFASIATQRAGRTLWTNGPNLLSACSRNSMVPVFTAGSVTARRFSEEDCTRI